ncbi:GNAT family N-acetyltransferase [Tenacibaculum sp. TC6]|uniref:GNAT family N-acetyltransferase n=1 Tax=Tenacibaculum sp. TC6 TaxID=3423223 RepID=UPI003D35DE9F
MQKYLFTSDRLGFRNWQSSDLENLYLLNANKKVMRYFPSTQTKEDCEAFIQRMQLQYKKNRYCYFAVELKETEEFIGFIGLSEQTYAVDFNPSTDIGWRILPEHWKKGYAVEGAKQCLTYAFNTLSLKQIVAIAPVINKPSIAVMEKLGMLKIKDFEHPLLQKFPEILKCSLYAISKDDFLSASS